MSENVDSVKAVNDRVVNTVPYPKWSFIETDKLFSSSGKPRPKILKNHLLQEGRLSPKDAIRLVRLAKDIYRKEANLVELQDPITVCGDVHGQFFDLVKLLAIGGDPKSTQYLFLGDYVDRGYFGTECCFMLFTYKVLYPTRFHMIRGNHECRHLTSYFNFKEECMFKYNSEVYEEIMKCFDCLPIGAILNGRFLCVHGGISPELRTIEEINIIHRFREPPSNGIFCDLLWADPMDEEEETKSENRGEDVEFVENQLRGCSFVFSYKACEKFLKKNNLLSVIRAHEAQDEGFRLYKKRKSTGFPTVICIFSAPNYCDVYNNKGAIIRFKDNLMNIRQFNSSPHPYYLPHFMNAFNWSLPFVVEKVLDTFRLILNVCVEDNEEKKDSLKKAFPKIDPAKAKKIRSKVFAVARVRRMYEVLSKERESIIKLKGLAGGIVPKGLLIQGSSAIQNAISSFEKARDCDSPNEIIPSTYRIFEEKISEEERLKKMKSIRKVRKSEPLSEKEVPKINFGK